MQLEMNKKWTIQDILFHFTHTYAQQTLTHLSLLDVWMIYAIFSLFYTELG